MTQDQKDLAPLRRRIVLDLPRVKTDLSLSHLFGKRWQTPSIGSMENKRLKLVAETERFVSHADADIEGIEETIAFLQRRLENIKEQRREAIRMGEYIRNYG